MASQCLHSGQGQPLAQVAHIIVNKRCTARCFPWFFEGWVETVFTTKRGRDSNVPALPSRGRPGCVWLRLRVGTRGRGLTCDCPWFPNGCRRTESATTHAG